MSKESIRNKFYEDFDYKISNIVINFSTALYLQLRNGNLPLMRSENKLLMSVCISYFSDSLEL